MKKPLFLFSVSVVGIVAFVTAFSRFRHVMAGEQKADIIFGVVLIVMLVSAFVSFRKLVDERKGIRTDDEMTVTFNREAAFSSFPYSISMWIVILIISIGATSPVVPISCGIAGMSLLYAGFWMYYKYKGVNND